MWPLLITRLSRIYDLGCRYHTTWDFLIAQLNVTQDQVIKYVKLAEDQVKLINQKLAGLPNDLTITTHICIVLGLITSKFPELENPANIKVRIKETSQYLPLEQLVLPTQCGFVSTEKVNKSLKTSSRQY